MKVLEAQSATLTNYEVYTHLVDQEKRYAQREAAKKKALPRQARNKNKDKDEDDKLKPLVTVTKEVRSC